MNTKTEIVKNVIIRHSCWVRIDDRDWEPATVAEYDRGSGGMTFEGVPFVFNNYTGISTLWGKEIQSFDVAYMVEYDDQWQHKNKPNDEWINPKTNYNWKYPKKKLCLVLNDEP